MREYLLKLKMYVAWKAMHPEELEFRLFWKKYLHASKANMIAYCPCIPAISFNIGPDNSSLFFFLLLLVFKDFC